MSTMERRASDLERLVRFDAVRVSKLLEEVQFAIVVFFIAFFVGSWTDKLFPVQDDMHAVSNATLIRDLLLQLALIVVSAYYINKIANLIPFFFSLTNKYVPSLHGERAAGSGLAMAIIFVGVQKNFQSRLAVLKQRFYP